MTHSAKIIADSLSPDGVRLTSMEVTCPRYMLAQLNKHRMLSSSSASSRAIPISKQITKVQNDPYIPSFWGSNRAGMVAGDEIDEDFRRKAVEIWLDGRDQAVARARTLEKLGVHKEITNRELELYLWNTVLVTATEWSNLFNLRIDFDAQPDFQKTALAMRTALETSKPKPVGYGEWHMPYVHFDWRKRTVEDAKKISIGRCARLSYLTHDGNHSPEADIALHDRLLASGHLSPFEHVATPLPNFEQVAWLKGIPSVYNPEEKFIGNFRGWVQARKLIPNEADIKKSDYSESE